MSFVDRMTLCDKHPSPAICSFTRPICEACAETGWVNQGGIGFSTVVNKKTGQELD
jgi:hypothetical protein